MPVIHVIGAGLAGLSCSLLLARHGVAVHIHEAAGHAGGRCRSYFDAALDRWLDNGNHLVFSGNRAVARHVDGIGARDELFDPGEAAFPFVDAGTGGRWTTRLNPGRLPWWILKRSRRVPGSRVIDYAALLRFACAPADATVSRIVPPDHRLFRAMIEPFAVAVLNAKADEGAARLLWPVIRETFGRGGRACHPLIARRGLSAAFIDPSLRRLQQLGATIGFNERLRAIAIRDRQVEALELVDRRIALAPGDRVVLAVPPKIAGMLVPEIEVPRESRAIVNAHFRLSRALTEPERPTFTAILNGTAQWLFFRGDIASATVSAGDDLAALDADEIAKRIWRDVAIAIGDPAAVLPPCRVVKEKLATFAQTPDQVRRRPGARTALTNLVLAGDWTNTGLPATIEGALISGETAARSVLADLRAARAPASAIPDSQSRCNATKA